MLTLLAGCSDPANPGNIGNNTKDRRFSWLLSNTPNHGDLFISAYTPRDGVTQYVSGGSPTINGGTMTCGGLSIARHETLKYTSYGTPTFGAVSTWALTGDASHGIPAFTDSMYVPTVISIGISGNSGTTLHKDSALTVTWNADGSNTNDVVVGYRYAVATSLFADSTISTTDHSWYTSTNDDGSYVIPAGTFVSVPVGGYIEVVVARGNSKTMGANGINFHAYGHSSSETVFKITN